MGRPVARAVAALLLAAPLAAQAPPRLYVTNQDDATVTIIDASTQSVVETLDLRRFGFGDNAKPHHAQVEPDGSAWYVTLIGAGRVLKLDRDNRVVGTVPLEVPGLIALHPARDLMFIARSMSAVNPPPRLAVIRRSTMELLEEVDLVFPRPHAVVAHPGGARVYVASLGVNQIASVGVDDGDVRLVDVPGPAHGLVQAATSPDGRWLVVTAELTDELMLFDVRDPAAPVLSRTIATPDGPFESIFTPDGRWLFVTCLTANRVAVVDVSTWTVVQVLEHPAFSQPHGLAVSRDARIVYVSNRHQLGGVHAHEGGQPTGAGTVTVICAATRTVDHVVTVGRYAAGIGTPAPRPGTETPPGACR
jgi:DNA-binding beta-propeller fold protein YncE